MTGEIQLERRVVDRLRREKITLRVSFILPEVWLKNLTKGQAFDRSSLPDDVESLKDSVVYLVEPFFQFKKTGKVLQQKVNRLEKRNGLLKAENTVLRAENLALKAENLILKEEVSLLKKKIYGRRSEKSQKRPADTPNKNGSYENDTKEDGTPEKNANKNRSHPGRNKLPDHLPRERVVHDISFDKKVCPKCDNFLSQIGEEVSEQLERVRSYLKVIEHARLKYACQCCHQTVVVANTPYKPIEKGLAGPYLIAHIIVDKYSYHSPLYRQESKFKWSGVTLSRSTLCSWMMASAQSLKPIVERMAVDLLNSTYLYSDDTHLLTLGVKTKDSADQSSKAHKGRLWVYGRDGNHGQQPIIIYHYSLRRTSESIKEFLKDFKGFLHADAYSGYDFLYVMDKDGTVLCIEVACWAHTRRYFVDALDANPQSVAAEVIELMGKLYDLERKFKEQKLDPKAIKKQRQLQSKPITKEIHQWLKQHQKDVPPKSLLGKAISYALNNWKALTVFLTDGRLSIDNNFSERNMKVTVMGRKNYLFAGSEAGGEAAAILYSIIETCKQNGVDPEAYLADVLLRIQYHPHRRIDELLPYNWKPPGKSQEAYEKAA